MTLIDQSGSRRTVTTEYIIRAISVRQTTLYKLANLKYKQILRDENVVHVNNVKFVFKPVFLNFLMALTNILRRGSFQNWYEKSSHR